MNNIPLRSSCPIALALSYLGGRWTLLIVRNIVTGNSRFAEFLNLPERITASVLTDRLDRMKTCGLVEKTAYQTKPTRYEYTLTEKGTALYPILQYMCRWGNEFEPYTFKPMKSFMRKRRKTRD